MLLLVMFVVRYIFIGWLCSELSLVIFLLFNWFIDVIVLSKGNKIFCMLNVMFIKLFLVIFCDFKVLVICVDLLFVKIIIWFFLRVILILKLSGIGDGMYLLISIVLLLVGSFMFVSGGIKFCVIEYKLWVLVVDRVMMVLSLFICGLL